MYTSYSGKSRTNSNLAWHRPQTAIARVEEELMQKSARALDNTTDPLERLRLLCLTRGAAGIMALGRIFRKMYGNGNQHLNESEFISGMKETGLDVSNEDIEKLFVLFDTDNSGYVSVDDFIKQIRPPMSTSRHAIVDQVFRKLDKAGEGVIEIEDLRRVYCVTASPMYMNGEDSGDLTMDAFLANFEVGGTIDGKVTLEEFMNYYSGISVSIDNDGFFDLMMRQAYKL